MAALEEAEKAEELVLKRNNAPVKTNRHVRYAVSKGDPVGCKKARSNRQANAFATMRRTVKELTVCLDSCDRWLIPLWRAGGHCLLLPGSNAYGSCTTAAVKLGRGSIAGKTSPVTRTFVPPVGINLLLGRLKHDIVLYVACMFDSLRCKTLVDTVSTVSLIRSGLSQALTHDFFVGDIQGMCIIGLDLLDGMLWWTSRCENCTPSLGQ